ncbi:hypothetical protein SUZIE_176330 [Sciurus carolinensis]|uniref:Uncharacterized protein n=1 Tax=Sciurus carolinensis TaxID=30640 RepID=A0AA41T497_SCICA|nr:hypothetical protein [Sciurus carolinensis]
MAGEGAPVMTTEEELATSGSSPHSLLTSTLLSVFGSEETEHEENLNKSILNDEIEDIIKCLPTKKAQDQENSQLSLTRPSKKNSFLYSLRHSMK